MSSITIKVNEDSTLPVDVAVTDSAGDAVTPTACTYTLTDRDGTVINSVEDEAVTPAEVMRITLAGDDLQIVDQTKERELRKLLVKTDEGDSAKPQNIETLFWVKNLTAIT